MNKRTPNQEARVLIVDDEAGILMSLKRVLLRTGLAGHQIREAQSAEEALDVLKEERFHLVLTDYRMGGMSGVELLNHVHRDHPTTARVLMTGYNEEHIAIEAINQAHVDAYVKKPWENGHLTEVVGNILHEQRQRLAREQALQRAKAFTATAKAATRVRSVGADEA